MILYAIEIWHRPQKFNAKDRRIDSIIPDASDIGTDKFLSKES